MQHLSVTAVNIINVIGSDRVSDDPAKKFQVWKNDNSINIITNALPPQKEETEVVHTGSSPMSFHVNHQRFVHLPAPAWQQSSFLKINLQPAEVNAKGFTIK